MLDLSIARLRQILANIRERKHQESLTKAFYVEWQTKTLAGFIAATTGKEGKNLQKAAEKISLTSLLEKAATNGERPQDVIHGADTGLDEEAPGAADDELPDFVKYGAAGAADRNRSGTAEALLGGFR